MKYLLVFCVVIFGLGSIPAQSFMGKLQSSHSLNSPAINLSQVDTLHILAVMADFQTDRDGTTFGNGKFGSIYSQDYGQDILDPLPHDKNYFEKHLLFVKNYFEKVSGGKLVIDYTVLPGIVTVSKTMRNYSPPSTSDDFTLLADFNKEVWRLVDSTNPGFDFSKFNVFTVFHAGVGRDIALPGTLGNEHNLPSIFFGESLYKKIYGDSFDGFPVQNGAFKITNTIVMPETENREVSNGLTTSFFQLTINGLMTANIGSALGLPDLFNTRTGDSAIGRFGLMDPQAFFSYQGIFPPEPSPWEKIYLGWASPVTIEPGSYNINLATNLASAAGDTVILKIPINSREYYLVENRGRDVNNDGETVTYFSNGTVKTKNFAKDQDNFLYYDVSALNGVVTDADEFDWALPGSGILIWHIDENIIKDNLAGNSINAGDIKGVFVEEADGVQDIGQKYIDIFGDEVILDGTADDFWFKTNPSPEFYQNKFSQYTRPGSNANSGANSLIKISGFSDISNRMNFDVAYGDSVIKSLFGNKINLATEITKLSVLPDSSDLNFGVISNANLEIFNSQGILTDSINSFSKFQPATFSDNGYTYFIGSDSVKLNSYVRHNGALQLNSGLDLVSRASAPPVIRSLQSNQFQVLVGSVNGKIYIYSIPNPPVGLPVLMDSIAVSSDPLKKVAVDGTVYSVITENQFYDSDGNNIPIANGTMDLALTKDSNGKYISVISTQNRIFVIGAGKIISQYNVANSTWSLSNTSFAIADLKNDGNNYVIFPDNNKIVAVNISGASADNFSFTDPLGAGFTGIPLAADFEGDSKAEIIVSTSDGRLFAIDGGTGKVVNGFPLALGSNLTTTPVLFEKNNKLSLAAINTDKYFYSWTIGSTPGKQYWSSENGNNMNSSFVGAANQKNHISGYFPLDRAYNYPNPVYGSTTNIRYYVSDDSNIDIKIFDIAGSFIDQLKDFAQGGLDHETVWDVSNIQSGIYLARILATGVNGKSESKIIKIAVVK